MEMEYAHTFIYALYFVNRETTILKFMWITIETVKNEEMIAKIEKGEKTAGRGEMEAEKEEMEVEREEMEAEMGVETGEMIEVTMEN